MTIKKILKGIGKTILSLIVLIAIAVVIFVSKADFGVNPKGERLEKMKSMFNYHDGKFWNTEETSVMTANSSNEESGTPFSNNIPDIRPSSDIPAIKTNLKDFNREEEVLIWFGHSSLYFQTSGKRILVDPVFITASPVSFINTAFPGTEIYSPDDIPEIDYLIITHNHWDHMDYKTLLELKDRIETIICSMGIGETLEYWGFNSNDIIEMNWKDSITLDTDFTFYCLPAQHFSGRSLRRDKTLWASYVVQSPTQNIYLSGDGGYGSHFSEIGEQFPQFDLVILENGQYNQAWSDIHLMPDQLVQAAKDLNGKRLMTDHNSKYALSMHPWYEPMEKIYQANQKESLNLITPMIGEPVFLNDSLQTFNKWWN